jgi:hypothetical protein
VDKSDSGYFSKMIDKPGLKAGDTLWGYLLSIMKFNDGMAAGSDGTSALCYLNEIFTRKECVKKYFLKKK